MPDVDLNNHSPDAKVNTKATAGIAAQPYPTTRLGWVQRYNWLWDSYVGREYSERDNSDLGLFAATDLAGEVIATTRRLLRDVIHVVDVDTYAIAGGVWALETQGDTTLQTSDALAVWRRSNLAAERAEWARIVCALGDGYLMPYRARAAPPYRTKLMFYPPQMVEPTYARDGKTLVKAVITLSDFDRELDGRFAAVLTTRRYTLTVDQVIVEDRDENGWHRAPGEGGPHLLGVVPLVHLRFKPIGVPEHSLPAPHGLHAALAQIDSLMAQIKAISNRYAEPKLVVGEHMDPGSDHELHSHGRVISGLEKVEQIKYLEASLGQLASLWQTVAEFIKLQRNTIGEFVFADGGANTSGRALEFRATNYMKMIDDVRGRFHADVCRATLYAVLMDKAAAYDADKAGFQIKAPPAVPIDRTTRIRELESFHKMGVITKTDLVLQAKALGLIDDQVKVDEYLDKLKAERVGPDAEGGVDLDRLPLALMQLGLARERALKADDGDLAARLGTKIDELTARLA